MRWPIVMSLLMPLVAGSCLTDAIPPANRQNLVNPNGETYPVGIFIYNDPPSYAAQYLASILIQEVLGYNTMLNVDNPGSGDVAAMYGVTGCRAPNNLTDRGCLQGVTYYHLNFGSWVSGWLNEWDIIQNTYTSMAPVNKGNIGYHSVEGLYIPKTVQEQALSAQGLALEYYRSWNASWNQPSNFFGSISAIPTSSLRPCNDASSVFSDDSAMRRHAQNSGDVDGVVIVADTYSGRCDDGYWWLSPKCRSDSSKCVPVVTGGQSGYAAEEFMQKFVAFDMPMALGIASSWTSYTTLPLAGNVAFYSWSPSQDFLELSPLAVKFPDFDVREHRQGILTSQRQAVSVDTLVSQDLAALAPRVDKFADNLEINLADMNGMLLDQKNTGDSWETVACRWIQANRAAGATWQMWIPDESECYPGFGLYDTVVEDFVEKRENAVNKITCRACPPGTFSQRMDDAMGRTYICASCGAGTSQPSGAALSCTPCRRGEYQDVNRTTECKRCGMNEYQDEEGQVACKSCPAPGFTLGFGSIALSDCSAVAPIDCDCENQTGTTTQPAQPREVAGAGAGSTLCSLTMAASLLAISML